MDIIANLIQDQKSYNKVYNVGSTTTIKVYELAKKIIKIYSKFSKINEKNFKILINKSKIDPVIERKPQLKRIKTRLGKIKFTNFNKSLTETIKFYIK